MTFMTGFVIVAIVAGVIAVVTIKDVMAERNQ